MTAATTSAVLLVTVPLAAALVGLLLPLRARVVAAGLGILGAAVALIGGIVLTITAGAGTVGKSWHWVSFGSLDVTIGVSADQGLGYVSIAVGVVALAVQVYSVAYLRDDQRYPPYAAQVSLFTAAMLLVLVSGDLIGLLVGWEVMGACSYLLIAHDRSLPEAPAAAVKAFLVTRVGDVGFLLGVALLGLGAGTFHLTSVLASLPHQSTTRLTAAALLVLLGAIGKSAQVPLHT